MNEKKRERYRWIYDKEKQKLALEGPKPGDDSGRPALIQSWDYTVRIFVAFIFGINLTLLIPHVG